MYTSGKSVLRIHLVIPLTNIQCHYVPGTGKGTGYTAVSKTKTFLMWHFHFSGEKQTMNKSIYRNIHKMSDGNHF